MACTLQPVIHGPDVRWLPIDDLYTIRDYLTNLLCLTTEWEPIQGNMRVIRNTCYSGRFIIMIGCSYDNTLGYCLRDAHTYELITHYAYIQRDQCVEVLSHSLQRLMA